MNDPDTAVQRDDQGYLIDPDDWTPQVARMLADEEGLQLEEDHWLVLQYIRDYHDAHAITPDIRHAAKFIGDHGGVDKKQGKALIFALFPYGYVKQACKIAGMRRPRAWSTG